jgi:hypothetical protein
MIPDNMGHNSKGIRKKYTKGPSTYPRDTKISSNHKTRHVGSLNYTKPVTRGPRAVLMPNLSYMALVLSTVAL